MYRHLSRKIVNTHVRSNIPQYLVIIFRRYGQLSRSRFRENIYFPGKQRDGEAVAGYSVMYTYRNAYLIARSPFPFFLRSRDKTANSFRSREPKR